MRTYISNPDGTHSYVANEGEAVDEIAFDFYKTQITSAEFIYSSNQNLSQLSIELPAGTIVILPPLPIRPVSSKQIKLLDMTPPEEATAETELYMSTTEIQDLITLAKTYAKIAEDAAAAAIAAKDDILNSEDVVDNLRLLAEAAATAAQAAQAAAEAAEDNVAASALEATNAAASAEYWANAAMNAIITNAYFAPKYIGEVNLMREAESLPRIPYTVMMLLSDLFDFVAGKDSDTSIAYGLTPVNIIDNIIMWYTLIPETNVGSGTEMATLIGPDSSGNPVIFGDGNHGVVGADFDWDDPVTWGRVASNTITFDTVLSWDVTGLSFDYDAGFTQVVVGHNATEGMAQESTDKGFTGIAGGDFGAYYKTGEGTTNSVNGFKLGGYRGATGTTNGFNADPDDGSEQLSMFAGDDLQGFVVTRALNGSGYNDTFFEEDEKDTYTTVYPNTEVEPNRYGHGGYITSYPGGNAAWQGHRWAADMICHFKGAYTHDQAINVGDGLATFGALMRTWDIIGDAFKIYRSHQTTDDNIYRYFCASKRAGYFYMNVLDPETPAAVDEKVILVLQPVGVGDAEFSSQNYNNINNMQTNTVHDQTNGHIVEVYMNNGNNWCTNHASRPMRQWEDALILEVIPWIQARYPGLPINILAYSKTGWGGCHLMFRYESLFQAAALMDFPYEQDTLANFFGGTLNADLVVGTQAQLDNYVLPTIIPTLKAPFTSTTRLHLSHPTSFQKFAGDMNTMYSDMTSEGVLYAGGSGEGGNNHGFNTTYLANVVSFFNTYGA